MELGVEGLSCRVQVQGLGLRALGSNLDPRHAPPSSRVQAKGFGIRALGKACFSSVRFHSYIGLGPGAIPPLPQALECSRTCESRLKLRGWIQDFGKIARGNINAKPLSTP
jgi:hypothetical protein